MTYPASDDAPQRPALPAGANLAPGATLAVGEWQVDAAASELRRGDELHHLEPKATEVLVCLACHPGEVVTREDLLAAVWPGVVVGDDALTQAIIKLRKALGDDARRPAYIETISKRGYRLIAPVRLPAAAAPQPVGEKPAPAALLPGADGQARRRWTLGAALLMIVAALIAAFWLDLPHRLNPAPASGSHEPVPGAPSALPVIAVLPLANQSGNPQRDYFSDGITEDIIGALGRYSGLRVIARNSVDQFKHRPATARVIRQELGARYIVAGSVRGVDGRAQIAVELSDAGNAQVLWSDRYEGRDVFEIQERIVHQIVGTLAVKVTALEEQRIAAKPLPDMEVYDLALRARALVVRSERSANREARTLLTRARELAPDYAETYVVLAQAEFHRAMYGWVDDGAAGFARSEEFARKALTIDDPGANARAHSTLGLIFAVRREFDQALAEHDKAIALNPSDAYAIDARGDALLWLGRLEEALAAFESSRRLDPVGRSSGSAFDLALAYYSLGRYPEALAAEDSALARFPDTSFLHAMRAATLAQMGKFELAHQAADDLRRTSPFFQGEEFGDRFGDPRLRAHLQEGLRKAGL